MKDKINLSWASVDDMVESLRHDIKRQIVEHDLKLDGIIGIARGGLVPAVMLSHALGIRQFTTVRAKQYDDETHRAGQMVTSLDGSLGLDYEGRYLIVDDIVDTGNTLRFFRGVLPNSLTCALVANRAPMEQNLVDFVARPNPEDQWIVFPWEVA